MPSLTSPEPVTADPRTLPHAYLACGANLYWVLSSAGSELALEDCKTLKATVVSRRHVLTECRLVRAATVAP